MREKVEFNGDAPQLTLYLKTNIKCSCIRIDVHTYVCILYVICEYFSIMYMNVFLCNCIYIYTFERSRH